MWVNNDLFLIKQSDIPKIPMELSLEARDWWKYQKKCCIEGVTYGGRYMPGTLYFYINFWNILLNKGRSKNKVIERPQLRDIEWEVHLAWMAARGVSGFDNVGHIDNINENVLKYVKNSNVELGCPIYENNSKDLMLMTARETGKELADYEMVITKNGEVKICDIQVGDEIAGIGEYVKVLGVYPQGVKDIYRFTFGDGRVVDCGIDHLWTLYDNSAKNPVTLTTREILEKGLHLSTGRKRWRIPGNELIEFKEKELPIDPYLLGLLLGDGTMNGGTIKIAAIDDEIVEFFKEKLPEYELHRDISTCNYNIVYKGSDKYSQENPYGHNPFKRKIAEMGLNVKRKDKFIPEDYMYSSSEQRIELVRGLLDSDGSINNHGSIEFVNKSKKLVDGLAYILRSLGISCQIGLDNREGRSYNICGNKTVTIHGRYYRLYIKTDRPVFKLSRKLSKIKTRTTSNKVRIVSIDKLPEQNSCTCITIDNPNGLFLTTNFIVTHNSYIASGLVGHEWVFNGVKRYGDQVGTVNIIVGAGASSYSTAMLKKVKLGIDVIATSGIKFGNKYYPHPFMQQYSGGFTKEIEAQYDKKVGGTWNKMGTHSIIKNVSYGDNPYAGQGTRNSVMIKEEIGMFKGLIAAQEADIETMKNGSFKFGSTFYLGCVCKGTKVWTNDGRLINIEDLTQKDGILGYGFNKISNEVIAHINPPQQKPCYRITTKNETILECSEDHPILWGKSGSYYTFRDNDGDKRIYKGGKKRLLWKEAKDVKKGDQLCLINSVPIFGEEKMWNPRLVGMLIGDGSYGFDKTPRLSNCDIEINNYIEEKYETKLERFHVTKDDRIYKETRILGICGELRKLGIYGQTKNNKTLPINVYNYDKDSICELIAGLFDTDGTIQYLPQKAGLRISICSSSINLIKEIKNLCVKIGVHGSIHETKPQLNKKSGFSSKSSYYNFVVADIDSTYNFYKNIKLLCKYKQERLNLAVEFAKTTKSRNSSGVFVTKTVGKKEMAKLTDVEGIRFETVRSVEYIGMQDVYNLKADTTHTYIASNIITHNTGGDMGGGTLDAYKMYYSPETYDLLQFEDIWENKGSIAMFLPATMRPNEFKDKNGNTNTEQSLEYFTKERDRLKNSKNGVAALNAHIQYNPLVPSEIFLRSTGSLFPISELKDHLSMLETNKKYQDSEFVCDLIFNEDGVVEPRLNPNLKALRKFPLDQKDDTTGAITIFEHPKDDEGEIPWGRYIAGIDPYDQNQALNSSSIGSMLVMDRWTETIVCEYSGRPSIASQFYENCRKIAIYYNCAVLYENEKTNIFHYFETKNSIKYMMKQPDYIKEVIPNSSVQRGYGMHMVEALKSRGEELARDEMLKEYQEGKLNLRKYRSIPLLQEMIMYEREGNYDRVDAFIILMFAKQEFRKIKAEAFNSQNDKTYSFFNRKIYSRK